MAMWMQISERFPLTSSVTKNNVWRTCFLLLRKRYISLR